MKKTKIFTIALILVGLILPSCKDSFLEQPPLGAYTEADMLNSAGINGYLIGIYSLLNSGGSTNITNDAEQLLFTSMHSDEAFKGSTAGDLPRWLEMSNFNVTTGNTDIQGNWQHCYNAIARCNHLLKNLPLATGLTDAEKTEIAAQTRFLRGHYYFQLKRAYKNIPWIDETSPENGLVPNTTDNDGVTFVNAWPQITADFDFARTNLAATQTDKGRPNSWAAQAYYAKVLIYRASEGDLATGYVDALTVLNNVITNGKNSSGTSYALEANYHDLFNCLKENGPEIVWDIQMTVNDGTTNGNNGNPSAQFITTQSGSGPGWGRGWGFYQPTPWFADQFRTSGKGLPYLDFFATNPRRLKDDYGLAAAPASGADPFVVDTIGLDPRIDWTMSRRGIPLLDYGNMPGATWVRDQQSAGPYISKKSFVLKSQDGTFSYPASVATAMNEHVIRFADVLLLAAECEARVGSLTNARNLVNRVRQRMVSNSASDQHWVKKTGTTTNAANYRIAIYPTGGADDPFSSIAGALTAILQERALELGTEGHRFFDVARFGKAEEIFNAFIASEKVRFTLIKDGNYTEAIDRYFPIPQQAIDRSRLGATATLTQNPGY